MRPSLYTIEELASYSDVTARTIRYYTNEGLLPPPDTRGRFALYSEEHLQRLELIKRLKAAFLPLGDIKRHLDRITDHDVSTLLGGSPSAQEDRVREPLSSAAEYIAQVLASRKSPPVSEGVPIVQERVAVPLEAERARRSETALSEGDNWRRFPLAPGLELHAQLPLTAAREACIRRLREVANEFD